MTDYSLNEIQRKFRGSLKTRNKTFMIIELYVLTLHRDQLIRIVMESVMLYMNTIHYDILSISHVELWDNKSIST